MARRPRYTDFPRSIHQLLDSSKWVTELHSDVFLETVWDCYAWTIRQLLDVPERKFGLTFVPMNGRAWIWFPPSTWDRLSPVWNGRASKQRYHPFDA